MQHLLQQFLNIFRGVDWAAPTWDLVLVLFLVVGAALYGMSLGRNRNIAILFSIYIAIAIISFAPDISSMATNAEFNNYFAFQMTTFIGLFALLFFLLSRSAVLRAIGGRPEDGNLFQTIAFSILHVGLLTSVVLSYLPASAVAVFSEPIQKFFVHDIARFVWITAPVLVMAITPARRDERI